MKKLLQILIGLIFLLIPIYGWIVNLAGVGDAASMLFKGGLVWGLIVIGAVLIILGISELRD